MYRNDDSLPCTSASVYTDTNSLDDYDLASNDSNQPYDTNYDTNNYDNYDNAYDENHESMDSSDITNTISNNMKKLDIYSNNNNNSSNGNNNGSSKMFNDIELSNFVYRVDELLTLIPLTHSVNIKEVIDILMNQLYIARRELSELEYIYPSIIEERDCLRRTVNKTNDIIESIQQGMTKVNKLIDDAQQITVVYNDHEV